MLKATDGNTAVYYTRGFELISRREGSTASYYVYDGGLSVRALTNEAGTVTDTLVFDAFGNETGRTGTTDNPYRFQGEEQDSTGLYYLRARYMDPATGTFTTMDTYGGSLSDPMSLHKYLFANSNPVMYSDPSGHFSLNDMVVAMGISAILSAADSAITYWIANKDSDTEKYGSTIFGWNVVTAAADGFFKGFIFGGIFYALCSILVVRIILSVIGLCVGIQQGLIGLDEIDSPNGNTALGIYDLIKGLVLVVVSTVGIAKTGMEFLDKYGDGIERFGKIDKDPYTRYTNESNSNSSTPNVKTGEGYGASDPPVRIDGDWSINDMKQALLGHPPKGLGSPDIHHGDQMPGGALHEVIPSQHRNNPSLHPNMFNQGVTNEMRISDRQLHWWYRAREQGADQLLPDWIFDN